MGSQIRRIIIEQYEDGSFSIMENDKPDIMGLSNELMLFQYLAETLNQNKQSANGKD